MRHARPRTRAELGMSTSFDMAVVGGGIVGLATAYRWTQTYPNDRVLLLEKESGLAAHQTGNNSGVLHSGLYYRPGSAKARTCVAGKNAIQEFCTEHGVPFEICGKIVVATDPSEFPALEELHRRGTANGVPGLRLIGPEEIHEIEPHAAGLRALHVPGSGIIDFKRVCGKLAELVEEARGEVRTGTRVLRLRDEGNDVVLETSGGSFRTSHVIGCAGLHSDRLARSQGAAPGAKIIPFRGEYYELVPERRHLVRALIYPVPDARFPFLGVHFTRMIDGSVEAGPNAVLALAREGYRKSQVNLRDLTETLTYPGFWRLATHHWRMGWGETVRSFSTKAFARALARLVPDLREEDIVPSGAGVRAQALEPGGKLVDDFLVVGKGRALHVCNAPSPAATASLAIADEIVRRAATEFGLGVSP